MKNKTVSIGLIALLFIANPGLILAEEILPVEQIDSPDVMIVDSEEDTSLEGGNQAENLPEENIINTGDVVTETGSTTEEENIIEDQPEFTSDASSTSVATETITVNLNLRYNDTIIFSSPVDVIIDGTSTIIDNANTNREIFSDTVLGALHQADILSDDFSLSDISYYSSYDSFLINCLEVVVSDETPTNACYNWQYVVNDNYPFVGIDKYNLQDGDNIYFYFGIPRVVELSTTTMFAGDSVVATAKTYDYKNNEYIPLVNYVVGVTQPDPNNPWTPLILSSTSSNELGQATFQINIVGTYGIGLETDYYYPVYNVDVVATSTATTTPDSNSGGGSNNSSEEKINIEKAIDFLISQQKSNGSFGSDLYTDWATFAMFVTGESQVQNSLKTYLKSDAISGSATTDFERRSMALMSAGLNPYSGTNVNYISKITNTFDGNQFGDVDLINDDIFAIFPLLNAGYTSDDEEIKKVVAFLISKQNSNGSWESIDLTAAAIQALILVEDLPQVKSAISKARSYLKLQQKNDGGFDSTFATLWVMQAISALDENVDSWTKGNENPLTYIASKQDEDGGLNKELDTNSRIWATAYLLPAYYEKTWNEIMQNFPKPNEKSSSGGTNNSSEKEVSTDIMSESTSTVDNVLNNEEIIPKTLSIAENEISSEQFMSGIERVVDGEITAKQLAEEIVTKPEINLEANTLGAINNQGMVSIITSVIQHIVERILSGTSTLLGAIFSLFNF